MSRKRNKNNNNNQEQVDQVLRDFLGTQVKPIFDQIKRCPDAVLYGRFIKLCIADILKITGETLKELEELKGVSFLEKDEAFVEIMKIHERIMRALRGERERFIFNFAIRQKDVVLKNFETFAKNYNRKFAQ